MYAVIETGGKQYRVEPGDVIRVESVDGEKGTSGEVSRVLLVSPESGTILTGKKIANAKVEATIMGHDRGPKIVVFHYKRKKQYKKTQGHRQNYTAVSYTHLTLQTNRE